MIGARGLWCNFYIFKKRTVSYERKRDLSAGNVCRARGSLSFGGIVSAVDLSDCVTGNGRNATGRANNSLSCTRFRESVSEYIRYWPFLVTLIYNMDLHFRPNTVSNTNHCPTPKYHHQPYHPSSARSNANHLPQQSDYAAAESSPPSCASTTRPLYQRP